MADIELTLDGQSSGAVTALNETGKATGDLAQQTGKSVVAWQLMAEVVTKGITSMAKWSAEAVKMHAESQRLQLQLNRAAGDYGEALGKQAEALSKVYAVDDDIIKQSYTLISQWGGAGAATEETTKAVLNYASATGTDAVAATEALIRNVESGGVGLAKMGIHFTTTGKKGDDLAAAVAAVNAKLGGAAATDADSLVGQSRAAQIALEDLQKSIGGMLATALDKSGALGFITSRLREMRIGAEVLAAVLPKLPGFAGGVLRGNINVDSAIDELKQTATDAFLGAGSTMATGLPSVTNDPTNKGAKDAAEAARKHASDMKDIYEQNLGDFREYQRGIDELDEHARQRDEEAYADELELSAKRVAGEIKESQEREKIRRDMLLAIEKDNAEHAEKIAKDEASALEKSAKDAADRSAKKAAEARQAGDQIGAAFVNALTDQLAKLASGGEFDAALFVGDILATVVGVAGSVIGTALGNPAVGAAVGNLAATGIRFGASEMSKGAKYNGARKAHSGGWVGELPAYHDGGWVNPNEQLAVLRRDERVLTPEEVHHMGGRGAVDNMARGSRGGAVFNVTAIDAKSFADTMTGSGGDGLKEALARGHGSLPSVLMRSPR